jgi:hypothetical protein
MSMRDPKSLPDSLEGFDPLSEGQKEKARVTVCHHSDDASAAAETMRMLGVYPGQQDDVVDVLPMPTMPGTWK